MQNAKLKNALHSIAEIAVDARDNNEAEDVFTWDAYESCKAILQQMLDYGYDVEEMLAEIATEEKLENIMQQHFENIDKQN